MEDSIAIETKTKQTVEYSSPSSLSFFASVCDCCLLSTIQSSEISLLNSALPGITATLSVPLALPPVLLNTNEVLYLDVNGKLHLNDHSTDLQNSQLAILPFNTHFVLVSQKNCQLWAAESLSSIHTINFTIPNLIYSFIDKSKAEFYLVSRPNSSKKHSIHTFSIQSVNKIVKKTVYDIGELSPRSWDYYQNILSVLDQTGKIHTFSISPFKSISTISLSIDPPANSNSKSSLKFQSDVAIKLLPHNNIAIVQNSALSVFELKYGTLQSKIQLDEDDVSESTSAKGRRGEVYQIAAEMPSDMGADSLATLFIARSAITGNLVESSVISALYRPSSPSLLSTLHKIPLKINVSAPSKSAHSNGAVDDDLLKILTTTTTTTETANSRLELYFLKLLKKLASEKNIKSFDHTFLQYLNCATVATNPEENKTVQNLKSNLLKSLESKGVIPSTGLLGYKSKEVENFVIPSFGFCCGVVDLIVSSFGAEESVSASLASAKKNYPTGTVEFFLKSWVCPQESVETLAMFLVQQQDLNMLMNLLTKPVSEKMIVSILKYTLCGDGKQQVVDGVKGWGGVWISVVFGGYKLDDGDASFMYDGNEIVRELKKQIGQDELIDLLNWCYYWINSVDGGDSIGSKDDSASASEDSSMDKDETKIDTSENLLKALTDDETMVRELESGWWIWDTESRVSKCCFNAAINLLTHLTDSHLNTILLTPSIASLFEKLLEKVRFAVHYIGVMERGLSSCFVLLDEIRKAEEEEERKVAESSVRAKQSLHGKGKGEKKTAKRQKWKKMVGEINDGVGVYAIEVFNV